MTACAAVASIQHIDNRNAEKATGRQDVRLCENNQRGVDSSAYQPGPYAPSEDGAEVFLKWYLKQLSREPSVSA